MIYIIDYGTSNLKSVCNALNYLEIDFKCGDDLNSIKKANKIILPGVGSYKNCVNILRKKNIFKLLKDVLFKDKIPFLGICVGFQILSSIGEEHMVDGEMSMDGLDVIKSSTLNMKKKTNFNLPHMGWNLINISNNQEGLFKGFEEKNYFYFLHSFHMDVNRSDQRFITSTFDYGGKFVSSIQRNNVYGVQFHPEKSQNSGLKLLQNFNNI